MAMDFSQFDKFLFDDEAEKQKVTEQKTVAVKETPKNLGKNPELLQSAQVKMSQISKELNDAFMERRDVVKILLLSVTTGTNALLLGPPGSAKTEITNAMCDHIENANFFSWLMNKTSDPSEILGPFSIKQMENDRFMRISNGRIPDAHIVFLDEIYKSNSPCLNALLTAMNEHVYYNDGKKVSIPMFTLVGASNEGPEEESLLALHDRFIFRINVKYVSEVSNRKKMHNNYIIKRAGLANMSQKTVITLDELKALQDATKSVHVTKNIINQFIRLVNSLNNDGIRISDRRQNECFKVMQGAAVLRGDNDVKLDDFSALKYVLWEEETQLPIIEAAIEKIVNPYNDKFNAVKKSFEEVKEELDKETDPSIKAKKSVGARNSLDKLVSKLNRIISEAGRNGRDTAEFVEMRNTIANFNNDLMRDAFAIDTGFNDDDNPFIDNDGE